MDFKKNGPLVICLLALTAYCIYYMLFGELVPVQDGLGFDGKTYASFITSNFSNFSYNNITRILPSLIVAGGLQLFSAGKTTANIILGFQILNYLSIALSLVLWKAILERKKMKASWLFSVMALFLSYSVIKWSLFFPVIGDTVSLLISTLLLYAWLCHKQWLIVLVFFVGLFVLPIYAATAITLFIFPYGKSMQPDYSMQNVKKAMAVIFGAMFVAASATLIHIIPAIRGTYSGPITPLMTALTVPSLCGTLLVFVLGFYFMLKPVNLRLSSWGISWKLVLGSVILLGSFVVVVSLISRYHPSTNTGQSLAYETYFINILETGTRYPFVNFIGHLLWLGPVIPILVFNWKSVCRFAYSEGMGMLFIMLEFFIYAFDAESRHLINFMPFVVYCVCYGINWKEKTDNLFLVAFTAASLLCSRVLWNVNKFPTHSALQNYNENSPLFFSDKDYMILAVFTAIAFAVFYVLQKRTINNSPETIS